MFAIKLIRKSSGIMEINKDISVEGLDVILWRNTTLTNGIEWGTIHFDDANDLDDVLARIHND